MVRFLFLELKTLTSKSVFVWKRLWLILHYQTLKAFCNCDNYMFLKVNTISSILCRANDGNRTYTSGFI